MIIYEYYQNENKNKLVLNYPIIKGFFLKFQRGSHNQGKFIGNTLSAKTLDLDWYKWEFYKYIKSYLLRPEFLLILCKIAIVVSIHKKNSKLLLEKSMHSTLMKLLDYQKFCTLNDLNFANFFPYISKFIISQIKNIQKCVNDKQIASENIYKSWKSIWYSWFDLITG